MRVSGWLYLAQQFTCGLCLLLALGRAVGMGGKPLPRLILAALLTALGALAASLAPPARLRPLMLSALLVFTPLAVWPGAPRRLRLPLCLSHLLLGLTLAGWARLMAGLGLWPALIPPVACAALLALVPLARRADEARCVTVEIRLGSHRLTLTALIDSGNLLRDPVTGLPVIVISRRAAARLMMLPAPGRLMPGMRLISVRTIAGRALMAVFRPSAVFLEEGGAWRAVNAIVGLSPDGYEGFQALVPASLAPSATGLPVPVPDALASTPDP